MSEDTLWYKSEQDKEGRIQGIIREVYSSLKEKGYNPVNQIVGYIISGDPTYITSHNGARALITRIERDELMEELVKYYINRL